MLIFLVDGLYSSVGSWKTGNGSPPNHHAAALALMQSSKLFLSLSLALYLGMKSARPFFLSLIDGDGRAVRRPSLRLPFLLPVTSLSLVASVPPVSRPSIKGSAGTPSACGPPLSSAFVSFDVRQTGDGSSLLLKTLFPFELR